VREEALISSVVPLLASYSFGFQLPSGTESSRAFVNLISLNLGIYPAMHGGLLVAPFRLGPAAQTPVHTVPFEPGPPWQLLLLPVVVSTTDAEVPVGEAEAVSTTASPGTTFRTCEIQLVAAQKIPAWAPYEGLPLEHVKNVPAVTQFWLVFGSWIHTVGMRSGFCDFEQVMVGTVTVAVAISEDPDGEASYPA
jgi:hypothetical protein